MAKHAPKVWAKFARDEVSFCGKTAPKNSVYGRYWDNTENTYVFFIFEADKKYFFEYNVYPIAISKTTWNGGKNNTKDSDNVIWHYQLYSKNMPVSNLIKQAYYEAGFRKYENIPSVAKLKSCYKARYETMMKSAIRKHKGGGGGGRRYDFIDDINDCLRWNEVTVYAHWAFSGNASVVASSIGKR